MSIKDKITPGPWQIHFAKWHKDGPNEGYVIKASSQDTEGVSREIAALGVHTNTRVQHSKDLIPPREYYLEPAEFEANVKAISKVPEMLDILERFSKLTVLDNDERIQLQEETVNLLNILNK